MISRRYRVQEKRTTRNAVLLLLLSAGLLLFLLFFGIPSLINFAVFVSNLKDSSTPIVQEDKTPPAPPFFLDSSPVYVKDNQYEIKGRAESGSTLRVYINDKQIYETIVDETSSFTTTVNLSPSTNTFSATTTDTAGNISGNSPLLKIIYDLEPPTLEVIKPKDGDTFLGDNNTVDIEGIVELDSKVTINDRLAIVGADGKFSYKFTLSEGENQIIITTLDPAENKTEKQIKVTYTP